ncbi:hypothetical protein GCM10027187_25020 [Streptosporangium sandarakinum]|uniref:Secreted protein n=1 Tax=Streptosporangium sandarakinum TaxID=1260955 RepID=A0A852VBV6_9ACTN|nr:hypothetical protein [Streptosporangium sandarakinum]NYF43615.1 hypothetical protein [Streptosporangium sandarakinum]
MRPPTRRVPALAAAALAAVLVTTGCSELQEVSQGVDKAQQCLQATGIVTDTVRKVSGLTDDPAALEKALNDGAAKLGDLADQAANTTLKEAADGVAADLRKVNVTDVNSAVDAAQKTAADSARWVEQLSSACS